jgi:hypothetical protein
VNSVLQNQFASGGLVVTMLINGAWVEACERNCSSACPVPRVEWNNSHTHDPERPLMAQVYAHGTGTAREQGRA